MARLPFEYSPSPVLPSQAFPLRRKTPRPVVPMILSSEALRCSCYAILDSGADDCLFPASFAKQIALPLTRGEHYNFGGVGSLNQSAWFFTVEIQIGGLSPYRVRIGFTPALEHAGVGLLGQNGFFDRFKVEFDLRQNVFHIED